MKKWNIVKFFLLSQLFSCVFFCSWLKCYYQTSAGLRSLHNGWCLLKLPTFFFWIRTVRCQRKKIKIYQPSHLTSHHYFNRCIHISLSFNQKKNESKLKKWERESANNILMHTYVLCIHNVYYTYKKMCDVVYLYSIYFICVCAVIWCKSVLTHKQSKIMRPFMALHCNINTQVLY